MMLDHPEQGGFPAVTTATVVGKVVTVEAIVTTGDESIVAVCVRVIQPTPESRPMRFARRK